VSNIEGLDALNATLKKLAKEAGEYSMGALIAGGKIVESEAKRSIQEKSPGHEVVRYRNGGGSYNHLAANEGMAPNTDTGRLVSSINTEPTTNAVFVGSSLEYAKHLEFSHQWLIPALDKNAQMIVDLQINAINKSITGNQHV
jgi:phage gpG-like protein